MTAPIKATLPDLANRVEAATGPDYELADDVLRAFGWREIIAFGYSWQAPDGVRHSKAPNPLTSLDAALSLVPERMALSCTIRPDWSHWSIFPDNGESRVWTSRCEGVNHRERALTAAALRAALEADHG